MALRVTDVSVSYGVVDALVDVSFDLSAGATALLGVNGAGKSSLLSVCAGILRPSAGDVTISSLSPFDRRARKAALARVSLMPQVTSFPATMTARDVVTYLGWLKGVPGRTSSRRADDCLEAVGLAEVMNRRCGSLSGGMLRRVALAQALASDPDVLLLDEPSTGLDPRQRRTMVDLIRGLRGCVLLSSHVVEDVEDLAQHVLVLNGGRLVFHGTTAELGARSPGATGRSPLESGFMSVIEQGTPSA